MRTTTNSVQRLARRGGSAASIQPVVHREGAKWRSPSALRVFAASLFVSILFVVSVSAQQTNLIAR
jgi:hypothetical protein